MCIRDRGIVFHPVLGAMVLAERTIGLTGVNLLRVLGVGGADGQRLAALAALDKPCLLYTSRCV